MKEKENKKYVNNYIWEVGFQKVMMKVVIKLN